MTWKALVPRVAKIQAPNPSAVTGDGARWWRDDRYVDFASRHALRWLGRNWITWHYNKFSRTLGMLSFCSMSWPLQA